jgi:hypothetical protein
MPAVHSVSERRPYLLAASKWAVRACSHAVIIGPTSPPPCCGYFSCLQVSSTAGMSVGGWVRINLDDPGDGSLVRYMNSHYCRRCLLLLLLLLLPLCRCIVSCTAAVPVAVWVRSLVLRGFESRGSYTAAATFHTCRSALQPACLLAVGCASTWTIQDLVSIVTYVRNMVQCTTATFAAAAAAMCVAGQLHSRHVCWRLGAHQLG